MYLIDRPQPSKELIRARDLAGKAIEQMMRENSPGGESSPKGFHWVKTDWTYPSFEHFTFAYKNAVFPVFVELLEDGRSLMTTNERSRFLDAARKNNLIPCTYRINVEYKKISSWKIWEPPKKDKSSFSLTAFSSGWNLWDIRDNSAVNPMELGDDSNVEMSEWEIIDFCVQIVRNCGKGMPSAEICDFDGADLIALFRDKLHLHLSFGADEKHFAAGAALLQGGCHRDRRVDMACSPTAGKKKSHAGFSKWFILKEVLYRKGRETASTSSLSRHPPVKPVLFTFPSKHSDNLPEFIDSFCAKC